jgi:hypothetical protein
MIRTVFLAIYGIALIALALRSLRAQRLRERYVLLFIAIGIPFLILALWPDGIVLLSTTLRIEKATLLVLLLAALLILIIFELLSIVSVHERRIVRMAQELAILRQERDELARDPGAAADGRWRSKSDATEDL